jgi:hypothetical protein
MRQIRLFSLQPRRPSVLASAKLTLSLRYSNIAARILDRESAW